METTCSSVATPVPTFAPSSVVALPRIRLGVIRTPPLAMVFTAAIICSALTETDWPNAIRSPVCEVHMLGSGRMPGVSPRIPTSVRRPSPNRSRYSRSWPSRYLSAASTVPMLEDLASTPARVSRISSWGNQSLIGRSWRRSWLGTSSLVRGVTSPASSRPAIVSTFSTEPGS